jgi:hypothetical protein
MLSALIWNIAEASMTRLLTASIAGSSGSGTRTPFGRPVVPDE